MISGIYKWTSPSGKSYIGQAINLKKRQREFKRPNSIYTSKGSAIDNARQKYKDFNLWQYEVLEECEVDALDERETYWISFYNTKEKGYNSTLGGDGNKGWHPSKEQIEYLLKCQEEARKNGCYNWWYNSTELKEMTSQMFKNRTWTIEQRQKISNSLKGRKIPREIVEKQRATMKKKFESGWQNTNRIEAISKKVGQYNLDGKLIKEHPSIHQAALAMGRKDGKQIRLVCQGKKENVYGYIWKFL